MLLVVAKYSHPTAGITAGKQYPVIKKVVSSNSFIVTNDWGRVDKLSKEHFETKEEYQLRKDRLNSLFGKYRQSA